MLWVLLCLVCGVSVVTLAVRDELRRRQREIRRAVWPWARAYFALRDGHSARGESDEL